MKRFFQLTILLGFSISAFSQIEKGTITLGGSVYGNGTIEKTDDTDTQKSLSFRFGPGIGYFVADNFEIRLSPQFSNWLSFYNDSKGSGFGTSIGVKGIKYFGISTIHPFVGLGIHAGHNWSKYRTELYDGDTVTNKSKSFTTQASLNVGFAYFINESVSLNTNFSYSYAFYKNTMEYESSDDTTSKTKSHGLYFGVGLGIYL